MQTRESDGFDLSIEELEDLEAPGWNWQHFMWGFTVGAVFAGAVVAT